MSIDAPKAKIVVGRVVSNAGDKSITVLVERKVRHPVYGKYVRKSTRLHAHDEANQCSVGDTVSIMSCRPVSKTKSWRLVAVVEKSGDLPK